MLYYAANRVVVARTIIGCGFTHLQVRGPETGGETPPQPAGGDACATQIERNAEHRSA